MPTNVGIWIDHREATVVLGTDAGQEIKKIKSGMEQTARPAGPRSKNTYTPNDFIAEDRLERKQAGDRKQFFDEILACIRGAKAVLILGPGEAKGEFIKHIKARKLRGITVESETTDKITDRQLAAKVGEHFTKASAGKSVAPKQTAKAMPGQRTKKTGK
jgi:hypothetical protein